MSLAQQGPSLYVPNFADGTVSVIDTPTNTTIPPAIPVQIAPITAGVRGDQGLVYVTNRVSNSVSVIDTATNTIITNIAVGGSPNGLAVTPDGTRVYVGQEAGTVAIIDATTNTVIGTIPVGGLPSGVKVNPAGTRIYVANNGSNSVSVIDTGTNTVIATIPVGNGPGTPTVSPDGTRVYVNNGNSNSISVINTATNTVITTITVGIGSLPSSVAFNKDGTRAYVPNFSSNTVSVINTATNTVIATIPVGASPAGVAVTPDGTQLYITNTGGNSVSVIDIATNTVIATIPVGGQPSVGPGICYNGNALLAAGRTFMANTGGAIACTLGSIGSTGPSFTGGRLLITGANVASALPITLQAAGGIIDTQGNSATLSGVISGPGALTKQGAGVLTLSGENLYTGATTVSSGTLIVSGSIAPSLLTTVNSGATLAGTGTVGATMINGGGVLAPGAVGTPGSMTVQGNLTFQPGAFYRVQVTPGGDASSASVTGSASVAGTVQAVFQSGGYVPRYTILSATGGRVGTFDTLTTTNLPGGFVASLSYTPNDVLLNLTAALGQNIAGGLTVNQQNVATAINGFFNSGGTLPPEFLTIFGLPGSSLTSALTQLSGEVGTGMSLAALQSLSLFLNLMLDPFVNGRFGNGNWTNGPALSFAPDRTQPPQAALPFASAFNAPPPNPDTFGRRWKVWGSAYGGYNKTGGDPVIGSHDLTARAYGFAAGLDYRLWPSTMVGFALGGAGTNWGLADALGSGRSDAFQAGLYASTRYGPAYLSAALAYEWHQASTERTVAIVGADRLTADFHANSLGARVESGYRFGLPEFGITPYAALQTLNVRTPSYGERAASGSAVFALSYNGQTTTATRSEIGAWVDHRLALPYQSLMLLRARAAWAHDFESDRQIAPIFQALPGASFTVHGASRPRDAALVSAGAELRFINGFALAAKFDSELANRSYTYAGTGSARYAW